MPVGYIGIGKDNTVTIIQKVLEFKAEWQLVRLGHKLGKFDLLMRQVNWHPPLLWKLDYKLVKSSCGVNLDSSLLSLFMWHFFLTFFFPILNGQTFCAGLWIESSELNSCNVIYLCGVPLPMIFFRKYWRYIYMQMWLASFYAFAEIKCAFT